MDCKSLYADVEIPVKSFYQYITEHFPRYGEKAALIDGATGAVWSYNALQQDILKVAAGLQGRGFQKGDVLAIYSANCPEYASIFYAVAYLGGINTTINPTYTAHELAYQLVDANARYLVTMPAILDKALEAASAAGIEEVFVFGEGHGVTPFATLRKSEKVAGADVVPQEDLLVLPYSSGTTGMPKGVMLTHFNIVANIAQTSPVEPMDATERLIGILPFYHIYGMTVILSMALRNGATVVTMPRFDLEHFLQLLQDHKITSAYLVPPIILALAKHPMVDDYDLSHLKFVTSGAAPLPESVAMACSQRIGCVVKQGYGLTETSPVTHISPRDSKTKIKAVGLTVANTVTRIVDLTTGEALTNGEVGEIWIRGPQVMKGYHNNPEATAEMIDEDGWLHTGDVGHIDKDGFLYVVDRVKELIKYKGLQIAPAELEAILVSHPDVADAAVIPSPDEEAGEIPKAFVVLRAGKETTPDALKDFVAERVAPYKKIRLIEFVDQIPKVPSGKILRRELVKRERERLAGL